MEEKKNFSKNNHKGGFKPNGKPGFKREGKSNDKPGFKRQGKPNNQRGNRPNFKPDGVKVERRNEREHTRPNVVEDKKEVNIRYYTYKCLYNIYVNGAFSNIEIDHTIRENNISPLDAKLLTNIVYGTLSHEKILMWELRKLSEKAPKDEARVILLMSLYQLKYLDRIPDFAVLNEAVGIAKKEGGEAMGKFVNAILRESQRQNLTFTREDAKDDYEYLSITSNIPVFVIKMWESNYGKEKTATLLKYSNIEPPLTLRVNINKASKEELLAKEYFSEGKLAKNSLIYNGDTAISSLEEFKQGLVSVQDESSQYVVEVLDPQENDRVIDMCAAPGSKTQYIATLANKSKVLAIDIHQHRVDIMKSYLHELGLDNVFCVCDDSTKLHLRTKLVGTFDKVLLDAPCLGLGVIRRKPDILHGLSDTQLDEIVLLQEKLLDEAYLMAKNGGTIVYSTCSIDKKENDNQVTKFLARHKDVKRVFEKQIFPNEYDSDGFYICKLVKE